MAKKKLNTNNILLLAGVGIAAYFLFKKFMNPALPPPPPPPPPTPSSSTGTSLPAPCNNKVTFDWNSVEIQNYNLIDRDLQLKKITQNELIGATKKHTTAYLQAWLNQKHNTCLVVDGIFGTYTESALLSKTGKTSASLNELSAIYMFGQGGALG